MRELSDELLELVAAMALADDMPGAMAVLAQRAQELVPCDGFSVMWLDEDHVRVLHSSGPTAPSLGLVLPASQVSKALPVVEGGRTVLVADAGEDPDWRRVPGEERVRAWLGAPLLLGERILGLLEWTAQEPSHFALDQEAAAAELGRCAASVLHRTWLMDELRRRLRDLTERQAPLAGEPGDPASALAPIVSEARQATGARHGFLFLSGGEGGEMRCAAASGELREQLRTTILHGDGSLGGWTAPTGTPTIRRKYLRSDRDVLTALGIRTSLTLPVRVKGQAVGLLGVAERREGGSFGRDAVRTMTNLASQASELLERASYPGTDAEGYDYERIVQFSPLAVGVLAQAGEIRFCNPGLADMLSRSAPSLVGQNLLDLLSTADRRRLARALAEVAANGTRQQLDLHLPSPVNPRHVRVWLALARMTEDRGGELVAVLEDVTALKILEEERVQYLRELTEKNDQLRELDLMRGRFVSNVSHELRTPMAVIKLYAALARKGRPEKQAHYLQTIEQEIHRLEAMVENVLDLTRLDRQALQLHLEPLEAEEIIAQVLGVYAEEADRRGIGLTNAVRGPLPRLWVDRAHLVQMLTNLVDNALRYTPRGGQVWVAAHLTRWDSRPAVEIVVGDTGAGIPKEEHLRVFERFFRGSNNPPTSTGTGLGLAIVQELMALHRGRVTLRSQPGEGSQFGLQFPLEEAQARAEAG